MKTRERRATVSGPGFMVLINILDIIYIVNIILGDIYTDEVINHISDLNYDGLTNIIDIILLVNYILNIQF